MKKFAIVIFCLATPSHALAAVDKFDLICSSETQKAVSRFRVDLTANEWCINECKEIERIHSSTSGKITFKDEGDRSLNVTRRFIEVNRLTGVLQDIYDDYKFFDHNSFYKCEPAEFTGLPKGDAKF